MEHQSTQLPSTEELAETSYQLTTTSPNSFPEQRVSSQDVKELYQKFRRATLESTARELRKQQYERIQSQVEILNIPIDNISVQDFLSRLK